MCVILEPSAGYAMNCNCSETLSFCLYFTASDPNLFLAFLESDLLQFGAVLISGPEKYKQDSEISQLVMSIAIKVLRNLYHCIS